MRLLQSVETRSQSGARYQPLIRAVTAWSVLSVGLALARVIYSRQSALLWLSANLFLAWMPLMFALVVQRTFEHGTFAPSANRTRHRLFCAAGWLLFFPNAPYLLTDLVHLHPRPPVPVWFDILLFMSFAWTGLILGFLSLRILHEVVRQRRGELAGHGFAVGTLALGSFGVYMGRMGRWNSWDIATRPFALVRWCIGSFAPENILGAMGFCGTLFLFLVAVYATLSCVLEANGPRPRTDGRAWRI